eukprot:364183-Chlamydomonas_euryale.AAC.1
MDQSCRHRTTKLMLNKGRLHKCTAVQLQDCFSEPCYGDCAAAHTVEASRAGRKGRRVLAGALLFTTAASCGALAARMHSLSEV